MKFDLRKSANSPPEITACHGKHHHYSCDFRHIACRCGVIRVAYPVSLYCGTSPPCAFFAPLEEAMMDWRQSPSLHAPFGNGGDRAPDRTERAPSAASPIRAIWLWPPARSGPDATTAHPKLPLILGLGVGVVVWPSWSAEPALGEEEPEPKKPACCRHRTASPERVAGRLERGDVQRDRGRQPGRRTG